MRVELIYKTLGHRMARLRKRAGMSQTDLAKSMGLKSPVSVSNMELGRKRMHVAQLVSAAMALRVRVSDLLGMP